jgi:hypothetical protein
MQPASGLLEMQNKFIKRACIYVTSYLPVLLYSVYWFQLRSLTDARTKDGRRDCLHDSLGSYHDILEPHTIGSMSSMRSTIYTIDSMLTLYKFIRVATIALLLRASICVSTIPASTCGHDCFAIENVNLVCLIVSIVIY